MEIEIKFRTSGLKNGVAPSTRLQAIGKDKIITFKKRKNERENHYRSHESSPSFVYPPLHYL